MQARSNNAISKFDIAECQGDSRLARRTRRKRMQINMFKQAGKALMLAAALLPLAILPASAQQYHVTDLGVLTDGSYVGADSEAFQINDAGQVVAQTDFANGELFWSIGSLWENGSLYSMGHGLTGYGINSNGQIAGEDSSGDAIIWQLNTGVVANLGILPGFSYNPGQGINDNGVVCGSAYSNGNDIWHAFAYGLGSNPWGSYQMNDLGTLGGSGSWANAVDNHWVVAGYSTPNNAVAHAFASIYELGPNGYGWDMYDLDPGNSLSTYAFGDTLQDNNDDYIVGYQLNADDTTSALLYSFNDNQDAVNWRKVLIDPDGSNFRDAAYGVNQAGQVVGEGINSAHTANVAILWTNPANPGIDLNTTIPSNAGWQLLCANGINDSGQIVGYGYNPNRNLRGFLLTPIVLKTLSLKYSSVIGGNSDPATVSLNYPAAFNTTVVLTSSNRAVARPTVSSITIRQGLQTGAFTVATSKVSRTTYVTIMATANGVSKSMTLTVKP